MADASNDRWRAYYVCDRIKCGLNYYTINKEYNLSQKCHKCYKLNSPETQVSFSRKLNILLDTHSMFLNSSCISSPEKLCQGSFDGQMDMNTHQLQFAATKTKRQPKFKKIFLEIKLNKMIQICLFLWLKWIPIRVSFHSKKIDSKIVQKTYSYEKLVEIYGRSYNLNNYISKFYRETIYQHTQLFIAFALSSEHS